MPTNACQFFMNAKAVNQFKNPLPGTAVFIVVTALLNVPLFRRGLYVAANQSRQLLKADQCILFDGTGYWYHLY